MVRKFVKKLSQSELGRVGWNMVGSVGVSKMDSYQLFGLCINAPDVWVTATPSLSISTSTDALELELELELESSEIDLELSKNENVKQNVEKVKRKKE